MKRKVFSFLFLFMIALIVPMNAEENTESKIKITDQEIELLEFYNRLYDEEQIETPAYRSSYSTHIDTQDILEYRATLASSNKTYSHYFKNTTGWKLYGDTGKYTLAVHYNPNAMFPYVQNGNQQLANVSTAFNLLKQKFARPKSKWTNTESLAAQFHCHALTIGKLKNPWNIEPWRTEKNLTKVIAAGCNPN